MENFESFSLSISLKKSIASMGFTKPTPIQAQSIPVALTDKDVLATAQTGSGKTAAFCIPILSKIEKDPQAAALILVPTREIASQITDVLRGLTKNSSHISGALLMGGMPMGPQIQHLSKKPRIIIATPGRLVDHLKRGTAKISATNILVLDEADRMLDMGFSAQLNEVLRHLPAKRQTLFFSATFPPEIQKLANKYLKNPTRVSVGQISAPVKEIKQSVIQILASKKSGTLETELNTRKGLVLIFARTKHRADKLTKELTGKGYNANRIHGGRTQNQRIAALNGFRDGKFRILVATDLAARGIDVPQIAHVINYDLPQCPEDYVHRIGRTARAGAKGEAVSFVTPEDRDQWKQISRLLAKAQPS